MAFCNELLFVEPTLRHTFLAARGFDPQGSRTGGIVHPTRVELNPGNLIVRFFQDERGRWGQWWATPRELSRVVAHFGREGEAFDSGRAQGKGILQGTLAVRHEWGGLNPEHMARFWIARVAKPLLAFYGEGDVAPSADQKQTLKPVQIGGADGKRRSAMQVFLPQLWEHKDALQQVGEGAAADLASQIQAYAGQRLPFEA
jgi:hypothetical protein